MGSSIVQIDITILNEYDDTILINLNDSFVTEYTETIAIDECSDFDTENKFMHMHINQAF